MNPVLKAELRTLSQAERILLVEEIWDGIAAEPQGVPISPEQRAELDRRLNALEANPDPGRSWQDFRDELLRR